MTTKKEFFIANLSGGKDSSCMTLKLLEEGYPVDMILFYLFRNRIRETL